MLSSITVKFETFYKRGGGAMAIMFSPESQPQNKAILEWFLRYNTNKGIKTENGSNFLI